MKKVLIIIALVLLNCSSDDKPNIANQDLVGKWKIIEQLVDPGDGSGTFQPITSDRTFEFFSNGTVKVNGNMCAMGNTVKTESTGTYEFSNDPAIDSQFEGTIYPDDCVFSEARIYFNLTLDGHLLLWYLCIEGCGEKYEKLN